MVTANSRDNTVSVLVNQTFLAGDANKDDMVSFADYQVLEAHYDQAGQDWSTGDFNNDGKVTFADYQLLEANFGKSFIYAATIPPADLQAASAKALSIFTEAVQPAARSEGAAARQSLASLDSPGTFDRLGFFHHQRQASRQADGLRLVAPAHPQADLDQLDLLGEFDLLATT